MALQKKLDLSTDQVFGMGRGEGKITEIKGYYLGSRTVNTANGDSVIHVFQTPKGNVGVWGTAKLNSNFTAGDLGVYQEIFYKGKVKLAGGKTQHTYDFMNDLENTIEVAPLPVGSSKANVEFVDADDYDNNEITGVSGNRAQHVSDLLNKRA